jgi:valyl-tRNA synthetase
MPFISEAIWAALTEASPEAIRGEPLLIGARWPTPGEHVVQTDSEFDDLAGLIRGVRNLRTETGVAASTWLPLMVAPADDAAREAIDRGRIYLGPLARVRPIELAADGDRPDTVAPTALGAAWLGAEVVEEGARERHEAQAADIARGIDRLRALLANEDFTAKAPPPVVEKERARLADLEEQLRQLGEQPGAEAR